MISFDKIKNNDQGNRKQKCSVCNDEIYGSKYIGEKEKYSINNN